MFIYSFCFRPRNILSWNIKWYASILYAMVKLRNFWPSSVQNCELIVRLPKKKIWRGTNTKKLKDIWWKRLQITVCLSHASNLSLHSQMDYYFLSLFSQKRERERKTGMNAWMLVFAKNGHNNSILHHY